MHKRETWLFTSLIMTFLLFSTSLKIKPQSLAFLKGLDLSNLNCLTNSIAHLSPQIFYNPTTVAFPWNQMPLSFLGQYMGSCYSLRLAQSPSVPCNYFPWLLVHPDPSLTSKLKTHFLRNDSLISVFILYLPSRVDSLNSCSLRVMFLLQHANLSL